MSKKISNYDQAILDTTRPRQVSRPPTINEYKIHYIGFTNEEILSNIELVETKGWKFHSFVPLTGTSTNRDSVRALFTADKS
jgi:hypothetical protein